MSSPLFVHGVLVNPFSRSMEGVTITIEEAVITAIDPNPSVKGPYILPGFVDAHVHIESSMLIPSQFARMAYKHGTIAVVADPHEVANVAGVPALDFMLLNSMQSPVQFFYGVPSCVPASPIERSGATLGSMVVDELLSRSDFLFLAEMMNFTGVLSSDSEVHMKLDSAKRRLKPIDGHAPGLTGRPLEQYIQAGISTDHECSSLEEAKEKISLGMKILIREGSAARNFDTLVPLVALYPTMVMFCTDDCHPDYLEKGHINTLAARAVSMGYSIYDVLMAASVNPITHYNLPIGLLRKGDTADFTVVSSLETFRSVTTFYRGEDMSLRSGNTSSEPVTPPPFIFRKQRSVQCLSIAAAAKTINVIRANDGDLLTDWETLSHDVPLGELIQPNPNKDLLKIVLLDRYSEAKPVVAFVKGFGFKYGAIATSVAHDSHHILGIGCSDTDIATALEWVVGSSGGVCFAHGTAVHGIKLPYYGLMCGLECEEAASQYAMLNTMLLDAGSTLKSPFMAASFMALTVIPKLKIFHGGLFDAESFKPVPLFVT